MMYTSLCVETRLPSGVKKWWLGLVSRACPEPMVVNDSFFKFPRMASCNLSARSWRKHEASWLPVHCPSCTNLKAAVNAETPLTMLATCGSIMTASLWPTLDLYSFKRLLMLCLESCNGNKVLVKPHRVACNKFGENGKMRFFDKIAVVAVDRVNEQFEGDKIELDLIVWFFKCVKFLVSQQILDRNLAKISWKAKKNRESN